MFYPVRQCQGVSKVGSVGFNSITCLMRSETTCHGVKLSESKSMALFVKPLFAMVKGKIHHGGEWDNSVSQMQKGDQDVT